MTYTHSLRGVGPRMDGCRGGAHVGLLHGGLEGGAVLLAVLLQHRRERLGAAHDVLQLPLHLPPRLCAANDTISAVSTAID